MNTMEKIPVILLVISIIFLGILFISKFSFNKDNFSLCILKKNVENVLKG